MKTYTKNRFSQKQRMILEMLAADPFESEMDYKTASAYFNAISMAKTQQLSELGGQWDRNDMILLAAVGKRISMYYGVPNDVRTGINCALYQAGEIHPALGKVNREFIE